MLAELPIAEEVTSPDDHASMAVPLAQLLTGVIAARLADALRAEGIIFIAENSFRADAVAAALTMMLPDAVIANLPPPDCLPGDGIPPSIANIGRRVTAFRQLADAGSQAAILVTTSEAAIRLYPKPSAFAARGLQLHAGQMLNVAAFQTDAAALGYFIDDRVDEPGEMAVRGGVIDIFPADAAGPIRIELDGGAIVAIRTYDPISQRSGAAIERVEIGTAIEPSEATVSLFEHMPGAAIALDPGAVERRDRYIELAEDVWRTKQAHRQAGAAPQLLKISAWDKVVASREEIDLAGAKPAEGEQFVAARNPLRAVTQAIRAARKAGDTVLLAGGPRDLRFVTARIGQALRETPERVESWKAVRDASSGGLLALEAQLLRGWREAGLMVITAADLLGQRAGDEGMMPVIDPLSGEATDFRLGDVVIHEEHGIGILRGIEAVTAGDLTSDAIRIEYAGEGHHLVPVAEADRIWRYGADGDAVTLDRLDGAGWQKRRGAIAAAVAESARGLSRLAAERAARKAAMLKPPVADYERFVARFPFHETRDQLRAIDAVRTDLASGKPMDRLVVGDVGYGKTEVALRAAALAALCGKQVILVAPTTVLVRQHIETFRQRFEGLGIEIAGLSRLSKPAEAKAVKAGLADGSIRIVIGTSALAGKTVTFANLGLVMIDEEQKFGAAEKLRLKRICASCHVLTLTATPIPRTLQGALVGLQELSIIATPPAVRQPIRTSVSSYDPALARTALLREKARGGQSFVVVPRIEDMAGVAERLRGLVPELVVREAHGKMPAAAIDEVMVGFAHGEGDVLLATNIIEAGLDVPRANTMLIWRADRFGLSQLHQLRGRVGRAARRGQILLFTDPDVTIKPATLKRLRTLEALDRLGAGFAVSARDLDMRGAGDLLGDEQAGHMKLIGVDLYQHVLAQALREARGEAVDIWSPELALGVGGRLPDSWIPEVELRLNLYVRLARVDSIDALDLLVDEMTDRFGTPPAEATRLFAIERIALQAAAVGVAKIQAGPGGIALTPRHGVTLEDDRLEAKGDRLLLRESTEPEGNRLTVIADLLDLLDGA